MKTVGLLGGMSWESTASYYQLINTQVKEKLGGLHSAKIAMVSIDFHDIEKMQHAGDWAGTAKSLSESARQIEAAGADFLLICTNTMHKVAPEIEAALSIPLIHIADATGEKLVQDKRQCVGLLGTAFTMEQAFYKDRISEKYGVNVIIPDANDRQLVHEVIYKELCLGKISSASQAMFLQIIDKLGNAGAEAVILGCTEIPLLIQQKHTSMPLYDTTALHAHKAVALATG